MSRKILLADDSVTAQNMGRKILGDAGYEVVTVNNGSAALKRIAEVKPDLIVLDVYMPGYSGLEVCQRLKDSEQTASIPVLLTVGKLEPFKPEEARRVRADAHIIKPFEASELLGAITRLEERAQGARSEGPALAGSEPGGDWRSRLGLAAKNSPARKKTEAPPPEKAVLAPTASFRDFRTTQAQPELSTVTHPAKELALVPARGPAAPDLRISARTDSDTNNQDKANSNSNSNSNDSFAAITPEEINALAALATKLNTEKKSASAATPHHRAAEPALSLSKGTPTVPAPTSVSALDASAGVGSPAAMVAARALQDPVLRAKDTLAPAPVPAQAPGSEASEAGRQAAVQAEVQAELQSELQAAAQAEVQHKIALPAAPHSETPRPDHVALEEMPVRVPTLDSPPVDRDVLQVPVAQDPVSPPAVSPDEKALRPSTPQPLELPQKMAEGAPAKSAISTPAVLTLDERSAVPTEAELAEALRFLTPQSPTVEDTAAASGPARWVAEPVALSSADADMSLEAEMFRTFAAAPISAMETVRISSVSAIAAAVENRIAESERTAKSKADAALAPLPVEPPVTSLSFHAAAPQPAAAQVSAADAQPVAGEADAPAPSAASDRPDSTVAAPKAMAAAASSESDPAVIASLVDRMLADLRPKIMEEITRKLSGK